MKRGFRRLWLAEGSRVTVTSDDGVQREATVLRVVREPKGPPVSSAPPTSAHGEPMAEIQFDSGDRTWVSLTALREGRIENR